MCRPVPRCPRAGCGRSAWLLHLGPVAAGGTGLVAGAVQRLTAEAAVPDEATALSVITRSMRVMTGVAQRLPGEH
jgi:hypothetical protein